MTCAGSSYERPRKSFFSTLTFCASPFRRGLLATYSRVENPHVAENLLSLLEKLTTFPTEPSELNKWWVEGFAVRPPKPKRNAIDEGEEEEDPDASVDDADTTDDWRTFFDEPKENGTKAEQKTASARLHQLTIHQSLHSLSSHKAIFSRAWLALLPQISSGSAESTQALATRALNVMHRGVMPHLTRAVLVMDWVASCVDYGTSVHVLRDGYILTDPT
jgi:U3 small nucleolar RNA-associated protein 19